MLNFSATVAALVESLGREIHDGARISSEQFASAADYVLETHARMPDYLRLPMRILTLAFDAWSLPLKWRPFHRLTHEQRAAQIRAWKSSRIEARRRLVEFYETLGVFGIYSELYSKDYE